MYLNLVKDRLWVHEINEHEGEFHTLFSKLKIIESSFFWYYRMSENTFCIILEAIRSKIEKGPVEEMLLITLT